VAGVRTGPHWGIGKVGLHLRPFGLERCHLILKERHRRFQKTKVRLDDRWE